jgi:hypothetical protein
VLLVPGEESSTPFGHLADGSRRALTDAEKVSAPVRVLELGGIAVVAHPLHPQRADGPRPGPERERG